jgi:oligoribonuclease (3'-5' exoribonuclease)
MGFFSLTIPLTAPRVEDETTTRADLLRPPSPNRLTRRMDEWCTNQHGKTGLTAACIASPHTHDEVSRLVLEYIQKWVPDKGAALLAGSTVHADMR